MSGIQPKIKDTNDITQDRFGYSDWIAVSIRNALYIHHMPLLLLLLLLLISLVHGDAD